MITHPRALAALAAALTFGLASCAPLPPAQAPAAPVAAAGPALWKLADADTTIYLFGTVHALPKDVDWYSGPIAAALTSAGTLVTEVRTQDLKRPEIQQAFVKAASLPEGQTLRALLSADQRASYEAALAKLSLPPAAFDRFEPWFAALTLATLPMLQAGYSLDAGVETAVEGKLGANVERSALETVEQQLALFDGLPMADQITYLVAVAKDMDCTVPSMNAMVAAWAKGDAEGLARLMNEEMDDPVLAERLLYARNRVWAQTLEARLAEPGTVFVAVGAGHLAGQKSVQDYLAQEGLKVTRVQ